MNNINAKASEKTIAQANGVHISNFWSCSSLVWKQNEFEYCTSKWSRGKKSSNERRFLLRKRISFLSFVSFSFFFFSFLLFLFLFFLPLFLPPFLPLFLPLSLLLFFFFPFFLFDFFPLFSPFPLRRGAPLGRGALGSAYCAYRLFRPRNRSCYTTAPARDR